MTAITLPLKRLPGQRLKSTAFFGGKAFFSPFVLILTTPFTIFLYLRLSNPLFSLNLVGLAPYVFGIISIADYLKRSGCSVEALLKADLSEAKRIFEGTRGHFRGILTLNIVKATLVSLLILTYGEASLTLIGLGSIISTEISLTSIFTSYSLKSVSAYTLFVCASEVAFVLITLRGLWVLDLVFLFGSLISLFICLLRIDRYSLRSFFEAVIN